MCDHQDTIDTVVDGDTWDTRDTVGDGDGAAVCPCRPWEVDTEARAARQLCLYIWPGWSDKVASSAWKSSIRRFVITEKAPTRAFSWLKAASTAFTFKTLLRHAKFIRDSG